jgi:hypothetical protein
MPREKIIEEQISRTQEQSLLTAEVQLLRDKVYRQILLYLPGYLLLLTGALIIFLNAPESYKVVVNRSADFDDEETSRMWRLAPYLSLFVVLMATIFFGKIFYQSLLPILKDLKQKVKVLVFYKPQKNAMAVFSRYYVTVPLVTKRQVRVDENDFNLISESDDLCIELSKNSLIVLGIKKDNKEIRYFGSVTWF